MDLKSCRFCNIQNGLYTYSNIDRPFAYTDDYYAIASIGPLVEGWTLIIPKKHQLSMKDCYSDIGFLSFTQEIATHIEQNFGKLIAFEHGANIENSSTACGTDHAHLHLVPFASLVPKLEISGLSWRACNASEIADISCGNEYLFYSDLHLENCGSMLNGFIHTLSEPISQYFRKLIADIQDSLSTADYKGYPRLEAATSTREILANAVGSAI